MRSTKHLFLKQSQLKDRLDAWIDSQDGWPVLTTSIAKKWLHDGDGLQDRGITRDLDWGIPVMRGDEPWPGMEGKVFYVWFDAPIEYIAGTAEWADANGGDWERWWRKDKGAEDVRYVQFMGKDNVPFHTLGFPATLLGSGEPWKTVDYLKVVQLSELRRRAVFDVAGARCLHGSGAGDPAVGLLALVAAVPRAGKSGYRIHLGGIPDRREQGPGRRAGQFRQPGHQVLPLEVRRGGAGGWRLGRGGDGVDRHADDAHPRLRGHMDAIEIRKAAAELRAIWVAGNEYLQEAAPWATFKTDPEQAAAQIRLALNLIRLYAVLSRPFIPDAAAAMLAGMQTEDDAWPDDVDAAVRVLAPGHAFTVPDVLFAKIDDATRQGWAERFAGGRRE